MQIIHPEHKLCVHLFLSSNLGCPFILSPLKRFEQIRSCSSHVDDADASLWIKSIKIRNLFDLSESIMSGTKLRDMLASTAEKVLESYLEEHKKADAKTSSRNSGSMPLAQVAYKVHTKYFYILQKLNKWSIKFYLNKC